MKNTLFVRMLTGFVGVVVLMGGAVSIFAPRLMRKNHFEEQAAHLGRLAVLLQSPLLSRLEIGDRSGLESYVFETGQKTGTRITVIDPEGVVLADSEQESRDMENHFYRPEIFAAFQGREQLSVRYSATLKTEMMYMSFPLERDDSVAYVLRLSLFMSDLNLLFARFQADLLLIVGVAALLSLLAAFLFSRSISRPVREFVEATEKVASGDLEAKVSIRRHGEFKHLAGSFNGMTERLKKLFQEVRIQTGELNSILASICEPLSVLDKEGRILLCNESFRRATQNDHPEGKYYWEVVRSSRFGELVAQTWEVKSGLSDELTIGERFYFINISPLESLDRCVVTLTDMTEFKNLERMKKDFVVNVSHELKTPLTAIKGFVETLESDAGKDKLPYLGIIKRNTDRMIAVVEDLLVLSELEEKDPRFEREEVKVREVAENILKIFGNAARKKQLTLSLEADQNLPVLKADPFEIERLFINLVDNALKYTEMGGVTIRLAKKGEAVSIEVADTGIGIASEHLPHVFERFYVADKSRSKKLGGTGLGLSIVKHIVIAHRGTIDVKSALGEGSTFTVSLPLS